MPGHRSPLTRHRWRSMLRTAAAELTTRTGLVLLSAALAAGIGATEPPPDAAPEPAPTSWSVAPATSEGPDGRARFEYIVEPGHQYDDHVAIRNVGTEPLELEVYAADAASGEDGSFTVLASDEPSSAVGGWLTLPVQNLEIAPRDTALVPFSMIIPSEVEPGDYAGGIVAVVHTQGTGETSGVDVQTRVGTRVYVRVAGPVEPGLTVESVTASYAHVVNPARPGSSVVSYTVVNTGNVRLDAVPTVEVKAPFGLWSHVVEADPVVDLFPGMAVSRTIELPVAPLGPMTVDVVVQPVASAGQEITVPQVRAGTVIWAVPWAALVVLVLLALVVWSAVRARRRVRERTDGPTRAGSTTPAPERAPTTDRPAPAHPREPDDAATPRGGTADERPEVLPTGRATPAAGRDPR
ncbi:DUF916 domain-containing protein [Actinotalea sp. K2]|uniref:COG1470 family protein n=1 Tax=Actinotalea sp. K2 TaxID=2939438 RepID=UPI002017B428|nr:DUF916 domain-containing protein [Actinotalea sp. K2]MCL3859633.1 DUF916 domain-containing protein [Actinotalea sp. K2]